LYLKNTCSYCIAPNGYLRDKIVGNDFEQPKAGPEGVKSEFLVAQQRLIERKNKDVFSGR
jgi:hypothetical protein